MFGLIAVNEVFVELFLGKDFQDVKYVLYITTIKGTKKEL